MIPPRICEAGFLYARQGRIYCLFWVRFDFFKDLCYWLAGFDVV